MAQIAILGATGHIAKGLIWALLDQRPHHLTLYARHPNAVEAFLQSIDARGENIHVLPIDEFGEADCDVVINAIGAGDPARLKALGSDIFRLTETFDNRVIDYIEAHTDALYLNFSSGAVYGPGFPEPAGSTSKLKLQVNEIPASMSYAIAKLNAEAKHRAHNHLNIIDLRVFSFFSRFIDLSGQFFMADLARCAINATVLETDDTDFIRDYVSPVDLANMVTACIEQWKARGDSPVNCALDFYSKKPVGKFELIEHLQSQTALTCKIKALENKPSPTGTKNQYYSTFHKAAEWGFAPAYTSAEGVSIELAALLEAEARA